MLALKWYDSRKLALLGIIKALGGHINFSFRTIRGVRLGEDGKLRVITNSFQILPETEDLVDHILKMIKKYPVRGLVTFRCDGDELTEREKNLIHLLGITCLKRDDGRPPDVIFSVGHKNHAVELLDYLGRDRWRILP